MRYFLDTEFLEDGETIMPISLGILAEDGRELYVEMQFDQARVEAHSWLRENVLPPLRYSHEDRLDREATAAAILSFIAYDPTPEFWAYFADYDWIVLCQTFGTMRQLPEHFPRFCMDLQQWYVQLGRPDGVKPPNPEGEHDALVDAHWNARFYEQLVAHARQENGRLREALAEALKGCGLCHGKGHYLSDCSMCHDSTWDHECDDEKRECERCTRLLALLTEAPTGGEGEGEGDGGHG